MGPAEDLLPGQLHRYELGAGWSLSKQYRTQTDNPGRQMDRGGERGSSPGMS